MRTSRFQQRQFFDLPLTRVFEFFSNAENLERITPPFLKFRVLTPTPIEMEPGRRIDYMLKVRGLPMRWTSEITVWEPPDRFVDTQIRGPYRKWVHEHRFWEADGGTWMEDSIDYAVPGGAIIRKLFVDRDIKNIFEYRSKVLADLMSTATTPAEHSLPAEGGETVLLR